MVEPITTAALIAGAASLVGGFMKSSGASSAASKAAEQSAADRDLQLKFAQEGIRWRVEDAQKAGIHPLYAMGAALPTYSPSSQSFANQRAGMGDSISAAGQDLSRAFAAQQTKQERIQSGLPALAKTNAALQNELLRAEIALKRSQVPGSGPGPSAGLNLIPGQEDGSVVINKPLERPTPSGQFPHQVGAAISDVQWAKTKAGWVKIPSEQVKQSIEDNFVQETMWDLRNTAADYGTGTDHPPDKYKPKAHEWYFSRLTNTWKHRPIPRKMKRRGHRGRVDPGSVLY